jgi:hypothetical protein
MVRRYQTIFNHDRAARQLMLGSRTPPEVKHAACKEDYRFGAVLWKALRDRFTLPTLADSKEIYFKALLVADLFFAISVADTGQVTDSACDEAVAATIAYLGLYLPQQLAPRTDDLA